MDFESDGAEGLYDRRPGKPSRRRVPLDTRNRDFTAKHFHEKLVREHDLRRGDNGERLTLRTHGRIRPAHRRERRALLGMMPHQDGSTHQWVSSRWWDPIVTKDDATSEIYSAPFVDEERTMSPVAALGEAIAAMGPFCSLYADRRYLGRQSVYPGGTHRRQ